eukprot:m.244184 g.244184  ORF g.244184 m.244184 type:complete len:239 (-) comp17463_c0_seq100:88-804(-)
MFSDTFTMCETPCHPSSSSHHMTKLETCLHDQNQLLWYCAGWVSRLYNFEVNLVAEFDNAAVAYAKTSLEQYIDLGTPTETTGLVFSTPTTLLPLFNTPLTGFDLIVKLKAKKLPRAEEGLHQLLAPKADTSDQTGYKNLALGSRKRSSRPGLDYLPELVTLLQAELGSNVLFFYDQYGGDRICVSFNPKLRQPHDFNMAQLHNSMPVDEDQVQVSLRELAGVIQTLAGDLVHSITFC